MKFPYCMLQDFVQTALTAQEAGDLLTMAGFELEGIDQVEGEDVLDVKVMSNRGDGLSMLGLAREILAKDHDSQPTELYLAAASRFEGSSNGEFGNPATVTIETDACPRYACRVFEGISNADAPEWIQERLRKAGQRPISLLVDLTNYVMLELGQPLHAFDLDKLGNAIVVREARAGERLVTLDGREHRLQPGQMMICDAERPVAAAGIMGGEETEVSAETRRVLLESANFSNLSVRRTRKAMGLSTEASYRFERSVDPDGVVAAIKRFSELLGSNGSEIVDVYPGRAEIQPVSLRIDRAKALLGMPIKEEQAQRYLERLGMEVMGHGDPFWVVPPSWRPDLVLEEDLIEELGRVHGYELIPEESPKGVTTLGGSKGPLQQIDRLREAALRCGFTQMISHSLRSRHPLDVPLDAIEPRNPASPDMAFLRSSLLPGLAEALVLNGGENLHLFEVGRVFWFSEGIPVERRCIAFLATGQITPSARKGEAVPNADFFSLKGDLIGILEEASHHAMFEVPKQLDNRLHPTRQALLVGPGNLRFGILGQIHPGVAAESRIPEDTILAEMDLEVLLDEPVDPIQVQALSRNPPVRRDMALLIDKAVPFSLVEETIVQSAGEVLESWWLFDVYEGQGIPAGKHSLGIGLQLRKFGENFTDQEANRVRERIVEALGALGASPR